MSVLPRPGETTLTTEEALATSNAVEWAPGRTPVVGDLIADRFELLRVLGSGGQAIVFEARDLVEHETVALKWLRERFAERRSLGRRLDSARSTAPPSRHDT